MTQDILSLSPERFGLSSFAELLSPKGPLFGEDWETFETIRDGLLATLAPLTPYECVIAESLVAIEWELIERRNMRRNSLQERIFQQISAASVKADLQIFEEQREEAFEEHVENGGSSDNWSYDYYFNEEAAKQNGDELAQLAISSKAAERKEALKDLKEANISVESILGNAYAYSHGNATIHEEAIRDLETRRREVMRDYQTLQKLRPIEGEVVTE